MILLLQGEVKFMNLLLYMSPMAIVFLFPTSLIMEPDVLDATITLGLKHRFMWLLLSMNSTMAYVASLTDFLVTKHTSALTLQATCFFLLSVLTSEFKLGTLHIHGSSL